MQAKFCTFFAAVALLTVVSLSPAAAQDKAKWTGTWKMDSAKSQFAGGGGPTRLTIKLELKDGAVTETMTAGNDNEERAFTAIYTTDGKESTQEVMGSSQQTTAKWEGDALVIEFKSEGRSFRRKFTLSPDGKTMTIAAHRSGEQGEADETVVLEKQ